MVVKKTASQAAPSQAEKNAEEWVWWGNGRTFVSSVVGNPKHLRDNMKKRDICQEITNKIIGVLDSIDLRDYEAPFAGLAAQGLPKNPITDNHYRGINIPALWIDQQEKGFTSNRWATFKQWKEQGASVRKGERGSQIIFYKTLTVSEENAKGEECETSIPMIKGYTVFNANQVEGYSDEKILSANQSNLVERIEAADTYCSNTKAEISHGGLRAFYSRSGDFIKMPNEHHFVDTKQATVTENYYATLLHELTHWTGAPHRLDRDKAKTKADTDKYAFEELVAELGAAFLCAHLGITQTPRDDHALYIKTWLAALKNDKKLVFKASAHAAKAVDFLNNFQKTD